MKKFLIILTIGLLAVVMSFAGIGCKEGAAKEETGAKSLEGKVITICTPWAEEEYSMIKPVFDAFEEETGAKIEHQMLRITELTSTLTPMFEAGESNIDVIFTAWMGIFREMGEQGHILDLTDFAKEWNFVPGTNEAGYSLKTGELYAMPQSMYVNAIGMIRKPFADENNLQAPQTWDEFLNLLEKIKNIDGVEAPIFVPDSEGWGCRILFEDLTVAFGGQDLFFKLVKDETPFNSDEVKNILQNMGTLQENGYFSEPTDFTLGCEMWANSEFPVSIGPSIIPSVGGVDPDETLVFLMPGPVRDGVIGGVPGIVIPKYSKNIEAAKEFIRFVMSTDQQTTYLNNAGRLSPVVGFPVDNYSTDLQKEMANLLEGRTICFDWSDWLGGEWQSTMDTYSIRLITEGSSAIDEVVQAIDSVPNPIFEKE